MSSTVVPKQTTTIAELIEFLQQQDPNTKVEILYMANNWHIDYVDLDLEDTDHLKFGEGYLSIG